MTNDKSTSHLDRAVRIRTASSESRQTQEMAVGRRALGEGVVSDVPQDRIITLDALIPKLKNLNDEVRPFAVFLGAGASYSAGIPLAGEIARMIEDKCKAEVKDCTQRDYATLMSKLLPSRRYELLKDTVDKAKLNMGHLYLAALVKAGNVDVVLTTNFDPLMIRALAYANIRPNVYDVPNAKKFDSMVIIPPAIVYLHGQFNSFITIHTLRESEAITVDIKYAITTVIRDRTLVVIGYGGENDPVFDVLKSWPQYTYGLYWVQYNQDDPGRHVVQELLRDHQKYAFLIRDEPPDLFFPRLSTALGVQATHIANKPFTFLKEALDTLAPVKTDQGAEDFARGVRKQVDDAIRCFELHKPCKFEKVKKGRDRTRRRAEVARRAREAWVEGKYDKLRAIEKDAHETESTEALVYVVKMLNDQARQAKGEETIPLYDEVVARFGHTRKPAIMEQVARALFNKGVTLGELGKYEEALRAFDKAIELKPDYPLAWYNKGLTLGELGKYEEALRAYDKAIELKPDYPLAWFSKGYALGELGKHEEELRAYDKAIELKPDDPDAWFNKGVALGELGKYEEALRAFDKAIELKRDDPPAWNNKGIALGELGKYEEALRAYDKGIELKPDYPPAWYNKGIALGKLGKHEEALRAYDKAIELKPDDPPAWYNKACGYSLKKNKTEALEFLTKAIKLDSKFKENAKKDDDFKWLWGDPDFKAIVE